MKNRVRFIVNGWMAGCCSVLAGLSAMAASMRTEIEADWLRQAEAWQPRPSPTQADAAGAVDGIKDGQYAFHTGQEPNPWWQVDLGEIQPIARIVVFNRLDYAPGLHNADTLRILVSSDGAKWRQVHDQQGRHFGGISGAAPLEVKFSSGEVRARFVRLQIPSAKPVFFHLDEVEIFGPADATKNLALRHPADQSSVSVWSTSKLPTLKPAEAITPAALRHFLERGRRLAADLRHAGVDTAEAERELAAVEASLGAKSEVRSAIESTPLRNSDLREPVPELAEGTRTRTASPLSPALSPFRGEGEPPEHPDQTPPSTVGAASRDNAVPARSVGARNSMASVATPSPLNGERVGVRGENAQEPSMSAISTRPSDLTSSYFRVRWAMRRLALRNPVLDFDRLLITKRFGQETYPDVCLNHMPWVSRPGGDLCVLTLVGPERKPEVKPILNGALGPGHVHGMDLSWDGLRIVFGYAKTKSEQPPAGWLDRTQSYRLRRTEEPIHLFEIGVDGTGLRQLTFGEWSDLDPTYAPNGDIVFVSERCATSLQCNEYDKDETSCNLYVMRPDGSGIRRLSVSKDGDYLPHTLDDGTIGYTRWEYHERSWAYIQSLWTVRPDGTQADAIFKQHFVNPWALEDVRSIPGTRNQKLVCVAAGHHTLAAGPVVVVTPGVGLNDPRGISIVTPGVVPPEGGMDGVPVPEGGVRDQGGYYMHPWPLSEKTFLASYTYGTGKTGVASEIDPTGYAIYLIDVFGTKELLYRDTNISCFMPVPLRARPRPPVLPDLTLLAAGRAGDETREVVGEGGNPAFSTLTPALSPLRGEGDTLRFSESLGASGRDPSPSDSSSKAALNQAAASMTTSALGSPSPLNGERAGVRGETVQRVSSPANTPSTHYATCLVSTVSYGCDGLAPERIKWLRIAEPIGWPYDNERGGQRYGEDHRYGGPGAERKNLTSWTPIRILGDVPVEEDGSAMFRVPTDVAVYFQILDANRQELRRMRSFISFQPGEQRACTGCHESRAVAPVPARHTVSLAMTRAASDPQPPPWGDRSVSFLRDVQPVLDRHCVSCHSGLKPAGQIDLIGGLISFDAEVAGYGHNRAYETILEKDLVSISAARAQDASITPPLAYGSLKSKLVTCLADDAHRGKVSLTEEDRLRLVTWIDANAPYHDRFVDKRAAQPAYDLASDRALVKQLTALHERRCAPCHKPSEVTRLDWINLQRPTASLFLTAPLAREAGGTAKCGKPVYQDTADADYRAARELVEGAVRRAWQEPRRDLATR